MATPAKTITMSITTSSSRRVNPPRALWRWGSLPVADVIRRTLDPILRLLALPRQARSHHGHQDADDDDRQHQFDQGEPAGAPQDCCRDLHACLPHAEPQRAKRSIWKIGNIMEITMNPTTAPTIRIITGSTSDVIDLIRRSASRSYVSAILNSERSNAPDSSPTAIMWVTGVGKRRPRRMP